MSMQRSFNDRDDAVDLPVGVDAAVSPDEDRTEVVRHEERLRADQTRVPVERVRLAKRIVTEQVTRTVEVRREELVVDVEPLGGGAGLSFGTDVRSGLPLEWVLYEEEVVVTKRLVPRERVRVSIERRTEQQAVSAQLRREEVAVEPLGAVQPLDDAVAREMERDTRQA